MSTELTKKFMNDICGNNYIEARTSLKAVVDDKIDTMCANKAKEWLDARNTKAEE